MMVYCLVIALLIALLVRAWVVDEHSQESISFLVSQNGVLREKAEAKDLTINLMLSDETEVSMVEEYRPKHLAPPRRSKHVARPGQELPWRKLFENVIVLAHGNLEIRPLWPDNTEWNSFASAL